jgi:hypothetical protein
MSEEHYKIFDKPIDPKWLDRFFNGEIGEEEPVELIVEGE